MLRILRSTKGFHLTEVLITLAITTVGLLGFYSLQVRTSRYLSDTTSKTQALWLLEDLSNRIQANVEAIGSYNTNGSALLCATPTKICAAYHDGTQRISANENCSGSELAAFDLWDIACRHKISNSTDALFNSAASFIPQPELSVNLEQQQVKLSLSWEERFPNQPPLNQRAQIQVKVLP